MSAARATLAKAAGYPARLAFNFGLATIFGLTLALGFSFTFNLLNRRPVGSWITPRVGWPNRLGWALIGAAAAGGRIHPDHGDLVAILAARPVHL